MDKKKVIRILICVILCAALFALTSALVHNDGTMACRECNGMGGECEVCGGDGKVEADNRYSDTIAALLPPVIAIALALITKEVYSSLFVGIVAGAFLYAEFNPIKALTTFVSDGLISSLAGNWNMGIIVFLVVLGTIVALMNKAGGSYAYGIWASKKIKTKKGALLSTVGLGVLIFIDDYFNCLTVGNVMRPVTDKHSISRAKLAYLIDATAAPVCMIAPISSWAAAVSDFAQGGAESGFSLFVSAIPFNFYSLLTIVMLVLLAVMNIDFGAMRIHEMNAAKGDLYTTSDRPYENASETKVNTKGKVIDLLFPIITLIVCCVLGIVYTGGLFDGAGFLAAFNDCDASLGLALGSIVALVISIIYFVCRKVISFGDCMSSLPEGFRAMVPAILILTFAWTLCTMTGLLGAKFFVSGLISGSASGLKMMLPAIIFLIAVGLSFSTGTSWGTFGILIPIVIGAGFSGTMLTIAISACLAGSVCGDHCSPISDTTIMASTGAQCNHINHVSTQLPYALLVAAISFVGYIIVGITESAYITLPIVTLLLVAALFIIKRVQSKNTAKTQK